MRRAWLDAAAAAALNVRMDAKFQQLPAARPERRPRQRSAAPARDLSQAAAFEDSQWPALAAGPDAWLIATAGADARRADALAGRGMSVVGWQAGDCEGCVPDLAARRGDRGRPR